MGSPALPAMMARQLIAKLAGGGAPQGGPQGLPPGGGGLAQGNPEQPDQAGQQIGAQLAELQGADPNSIMKMLQQIKSQLVAIYPRTAFTIPEVASNVANCQKYLDKAIKSCEQAAATANTVQQPIANQAGQPQRGPQQPGLNDFAMGAQ